MITDELVVLGELYAALLIPSIRVDAEISHGGLLIRVPGYASQYRVSVTRMVFEAYAESDPAKLRAELIQVAAVAVAWIEKIDRQQPGGTESKQEMVR